ncbi:MAG: HypC/HybG/HupF family hydrogenase formation chaperone [Acidimicrobiales bacterium]
MTDVSTAMGGDGLVPAGELASAALSLARRFAAGATMWCVAPQWPAHGRHVAVEFVHPVIVGKRALPAIHVEGPDLVATLRMLARPGDVLLAISSPQDPETTNLLRRSQAWGLHRLWLGVGPRPTTARAEHTIWSGEFEGEPALAARSGDLVLMYHLLWELTHVVFEHPGLLEPEPGGSEEVCITCSDQAEVAEVRVVHPDDSAEVVMGGITESVDVSLVGPVDPGELVLVHAGVALTLLGDDPL